MEILTDNRQQTHSVDLTKLGTKAEAILSALGLNDDELSILIVDDADMAELNQTYRNKTGPTNVLSFSMREGEFGAITPLLGDVVISADTAKREADDAGITLAERLSQLLVHGILHLVDYDHERSEADALIMETKSLELLRLIEPNPNLDAF
ncbi:rRNA maturation RNase YbeY [Desulfatiferula olefinivorans]